MSTARGILNGLLLSAVLWIALITLACPVHAAPKWIVPLAWIGCQGYDGFTSAVALQYPQLHEANPLLRGRWFVPVKLGVNLGVWLEYRYLQHTGHPKLARVVPIVMASSGCLAGVLNTRTIRKVN